MKESMRVPRESISAEPSPTLYHQPMAMIRRISVKLDAQSEAALYRIMKRIGWTKSQVIRHAILAAAEAHRPAKGPTSRRPTKTRVKS
jgi:hypothetical protein